ncbi:cell envelope integrity protein CreD [bacterium]|nr:cell envelope integrity protein CreD [bacterium]
MNEPNTARIPPRLAFANRCATHLKMAGVIILILLLLIPLVMIRSVVRERLGKRNEAVADITGSWGRSQRVFGPVLIVPYRYSVKSWQERPLGGGRTEKVAVVETAVANACFLPATLAVDGVVQPSRRRRWIYQAVVYRGTLAIAAEFARPDFASLRINEADVLWDDAVVTFAISDLRGVEDSLELAWGANRLPLLPGCKLKGFSSGLFARIDGLRESTGTIPLRLELGLNGSGGIWFTPVGVRNVVTLASPWPDPAFHGAFLPTEREVTPDGFTATWKMSYYGREYAQQWTGRDAAAGLNPKSAADSLFGVSFVEGIDAYRNVERAIKYGGLFLVLVFTAFFLFEVLSGLRFHPFQYTVVGAALCLFFLGLLSLSEFIRFGLAYLAAVAATVLLICVYCLKALHSGVRTLIIAALLAAIYGYLYIALQLQDYALLFGTGGLFAALAIVILVTRHIDWYARDRA